LTKIFNDWQKESYERKQQNKSVWYEVIKLIVKNSKIEDYVRRESWSTLQNFSSSFQKGFVSLFIWAELTLLLLVDSIIWSQFTHECKVLVPFTTGFWTFLQSNVTSDEVSGLHINVARIRSRQWSSKVKYVNGFKVWVNETYLYDIGEGSLSLVKC
jgi:hypothetical protein